MSISSNFTNANYAVLECKDILVFLRTGSVFDESTWLQIIDCWEEIEQGGYAPEAQARLLTIYQGAMHQLDGVTRNRLISDRHTKIIADLIKNKKLSLFLRRCLRLNPQSKEDYERIVESFASRIDQWQILAFLNLAPVLERSGWLKLSRYCDDLEQGDYAKEAEIKALFLANRYQLQPTYESQSLSQHHIKILNDAVYANTLSRFLYFCALLKPQSKPELENALNQFASSRNIEELIDWTKQLKF